MLMKYPRTYHLPWSEGITSDDKVLKDLSSFIGKEIVVTEKLDGENTSIYNNYCHARSLDSGNHESRNWLKNYLSSFSYLIPEDMRVCGENVYAKHSIYYDNLESYFYGFSIWDKDTCLSWDSTLEYFDLLGIESVPVLYRGVFNEDILKGLVNSKSQFGSECEGYVARLVDSFSYSDFSHCVGKYVRKDHVQTDTHWMSNSVVKNGIITL